MSSAGVSFRKPSSRTAASAIALTMLSLSGCKAREIGVAFSDKQAAKVDATWVSAAKSCWPALAHNDMSDASIDHQLADPLHFRAAFTAYASYTDTDLFTIVAHPVSAAPAPDTTLLANASSPLLTRAQAVSGSAGSHSSTTGNPPDEALCSIHPGTPVGFR